MFVNFVVSHLKVEVLDPGNFVQVYLLTYLVYIFSISTAKLMSKRKFEESEELEPEKKKLRVSEKTTSPAAESSSLPGLFLV
jgi:hypothetical protein